MPTISYNILKTIKYIAILASLTIALPALSEETASPAQEKPDAPSEAPGFAGSYLSGLFARSNGDNSEAIRYLKEAHRATPADPDITNQLQAALLIDGKIDDAMSLAEGVKGEHDQLSDLLIILRTIKKDDMKGAAALLEKITIDKNEQQLWPPLLSAWVNMRLQAPEKPLTLEDLKVDIGRMAPVAYYHLALINTQAGFTDAATMDFKNAIDDVHAPPGRIMDMILAFYQQHGEPATLKPLVGSYLEEHPGYTVPAADQVATTQDGVAEVLFTMGSIMLTADISQDAAVYLNLARYIRPEFPVATLSLGGAYSDMRQYERANAMYALIPADHRLYLSAQVHIAINDEHMGKTAEALALLDKLSQKNPSQYETLVAKGDLLRSHEHFGEAIDAYNQALKRIPNLEAQHWSLLFARGVSLERQGKWKAAEQDLQSALKLNPDQPEVLNYLAYSWLTRHEHLEEARDMLNLAMQKRPNDPQIIDSLGWALYMSGEYGEAASYIEKAVDLLPNDPTVNDHLGDVYWKQGRKTEARFQWERSLSFSPAQADAEATKRKIKEGLPVANASPAVVAARQTPSLLP